MARGNICKHSTNDFAEPMNATIRHLENGKHMVFVLPHRALALRGVKILHCLIDLFYIRLFMSFPHDWHPLDFIWRATHVHKCENLCNAPQSAQICGTAEDDKLLTTTQEYWQAS